VNIEPGTKVVIVGNHPHAGKRGEFVEFRRTIFGDRPVVKLENGDECFVMNPDEWQRDYSTDAPIRRRGRRSR
jgi:hypothetical protein